MFDLPVAHLGVAEDGRLFEPFSLNAAGLAGPGFNFLRGFLRWVVEKLERFERRDFEMNIDPIQQRAGNLRDVFLNLQRVALTIFLRSAEYRLNPWRKKIAEDDCRQ